MLGRASSSTNDTMQMVTHFFEKVYVPGKENALRPSTLYGYKHFYSRHLKPQIGDRRMCDVRLPVAQQALDAVAKAHPHVSSGLLRHLKWLGVAIFDFAAQKGAFNPRVKIPSPMSRFLERSTSPNQLGLLHSIRL